MNVHTTRTHTIARPVVSARPGTDNRRTITDAQYQLRDEGRIGSILTLGERCGMIAPGVDPAEHGHICNRLGAHREHRCGCGTTWTTTWPVARRATRES